MEGNRPLVLNDIVLKRKDAIPVDLKVRIGKGTPEGEYLIFADQYIGKAHLGRVNYLIRVNNSEQTKH